MSRGIGRAVGAFFVSAVRVADRAFCTRHLFIGEGDDTMETIYRVRALIGLLVVLGVDGRYQNRHAFDQLDDWLLPSTIDALVVIAAVMTVGLVAVVIWTERGFRRAVPGNLLWPSTLVVVFFVCYLGLLYFRAGDHGQNAVDAFQEILNQNPVLDGVATVGLLTFVPWFIIFYCRGVYQLAGGLCRATDAHPLLGPCVGSSVAWILAVRSLTSGAGLSGMSHAAAVAVVLGGPVSLTVLSVLEVLRLRARYRGDWPFRRPPRRRSYSSAGMISPRSCCPSRGFRQATLSRAGAIRTKPSAGNRSSARRVRNSPSFTASRTSTQWKNMRSTTRLCAAAAEFSQWKGLFTRCQAAGQETAAVKPTTVDAALALYGTIPASAGNPPGLSLIVLKGAVVLAEVSSNWPRLAASPTLASLVEQFLANDEKATG
jgi:uncharacterized membrane protein YozB (DUF420 family)